MVMAKNTAHIAVLCVGAAIVYGILHDQVTAHVCVEYFTIGHASFFPTRDPTLLALGWGIFATWWAGLLLGIPLGLLAQVGTLPKLTARNFVRPVFLIMLVSGVAAVLVGMAGYVLASSGDVWLREPLASRVPQEKHPQYLADAWAHGASYAAGIIGGIAAWVWTWRERRPTGNKQRQRAPTRILPQRLESAALFLLTLVGGLGLTLVVLIIGLLAMLAGSGL